MAAIHAFEAERRSDAETALEEAFDCLRRLSYPWGIGIALAKLEDVAQERGDEARAASLFDQGLDDSGH